MAQQFQTQDGQSQGQSQSQSQTQSLAGQGEDCDRNLPVETRRRPAGEQPRGMRDPDDDIELGPGPERQQPDEPYTTF